MKLRLKHFTLKHYIAHMRKQSKHMQHVHAIVFAGAITSAVGAVLLYTDYGFWHERYRADEHVVKIGEPAFEPESPGAAIKRFFGEAKEQFSNLGTSSGSLLEGKESYTREE